MSPLFSGCVYWYINGAQPGLEHCVEKLTFLGF